VTALTPAEAVEAAAQLWKESDYADPWLVNFVPGLVAEMLAAAAPHIRADERARVLVEVQAALRELDLNDLEMAFMREKLGYGD
jgi:hypothetical protein